MVMTSISQRLREAVEYAAPRLESISEEAAAAPVAEGKWSRKQYLGHLLDSAANNHIRFVRTLLEEEPRTRTYDQLGGVRVENPQGYPWKALVELWRSYNLYLAHIIGQPGAQAGEDAGKRRCIVGPDTVTLEFLAGDYVDHMQGHLNQILA